jgi:hypothetical protein
MIITFFTAKNLEGVKERKVLYWKDRGANKSVEEGGGRKEEGRNGVWKMGGGVGRRKGGRLKGVQNHFRERWAGGGGGKGAR